MAHAEPMTPRSRRIVVGVDGTIHGRAALAWALDEAVATGTELEVVHSWRTPKLLIPKSYPRELVTAGRMPEAAKALIDHELDSVDALADAVTIRRVTRNGGAARALVERSRDATLVVVGRRDAGPHPFLGNVGDQVASHAACPVAVVPIATTIDTVRQGVVVGVDGSAASVRSIRWAYQAARRRDTPLRAFIAWTLLDQPSLPGEAEFDPNYDDRQAMKVLDGTLDKALGEGAEKVERCVANDLATTALISASNTAELMVVGARGLGGFRSLLLGSVSRGVIESATCPAVVIRPMTRG
jgi:nucleotide-binding universal stress UspA family protein